MPVKLKGSHIDVDAPKGHAANERQKAKIEGRLFPTLIKMLWTRLGEIGAEIRSPVPSKW